MFDILSVIPGKKRLRSGGWHSFNAVCCHHRGHKPDRRGRAGIKLETAYSWRYHCFNCNYTCSFVEGRNIKSRTRQLLIWCGIDDQQISAWNVQSLKNRDLMSVIMPEPTKPSSISFEEAALPQGAVLVDDTDPDHQPFIDYLRSRGFSATDYAFMVTPYERGRNSKRIIIPYTYKQQIVGNTSRFCDDNQPKYINDQPSGYVFGLDIQRAEWQYCILAEGVFDALSVHGCAYLHNTISREQARTLSTLNRRIIVVPDQDQAGLAVTDRALELGYQVSIPKWGRGCKDINDAVLRYGRLSTVMSIIEAATNSPIKIKMRKQQLT